MTATARHARHGAVTIAARQAMTMAGPCEPGDVLGVDRRRLRRGRVPTSTTVAADVLERLLAGGGELVTIVAGQGGADLARRPPTAWSSATPHVDVMVYDGGQDALPAPDVRRIGPVELDDRDRLDAADRRGRRQGHQAQADGRGPRPPHRRRPAAPLPAPLRQGGRADPGRASCSPARCSPSSARSSGASCGTYQRPAHRPAGVPARDRPPDRRPAAADDVLRQERRTSRSGSADRLAAGRRGVFVGKVSTFRGDWQLTNPQMVLFGRTVTWPTRRRASTAAWSTPSASSTRSTPRPRAWSPGTSSARSTSRAVRHRRGARAAARRDPRRRTTSLDARTALDLIHAPDTWDQVEVGRRRYRFEEALVTQLVLARRRAVPARPGRPGPHRRRRAAGGLRRAAAVRADRGPARDRRPRSRPTSRSRTR